jgi:hypothetical protein
MEAIDSKQLVDVFLPYYFRVGNLFSEGTPPIYPEFLHYAVRDVEERNEVPMTIIREPYQKGQVSIRCGNDPAKCRFRLEFIEEVGDGGIQGWRLS